MKGMIGMEVKKLGAVGVVTAVAFRVVVFVIIQWLDGITDDRKHIF